MEKYLKNYITVKDIRKLYGFHFDSTSARQMMQ